MTSSLDQTNPLTGMATQLANPLISAPTEDKKKGSTNMTKPPKDQTTMVKIKTKHPIRLMRDGAEHTVTEGQVVEVTELEAKEFCDKEFDLGYRNSFGYIDGPTTMVTKTRRAERV
jgi:hypothetical protein